MNRPCNPSVAHESSCEQPREGGKAAQDEAELLRIGLEYTGLQQQLGSLIEHQRRAWPGQSWTDELEEKWSLKLDPIRDRMAELRWEAVRCPATSFPELSTKATILMDLVDNSANDVIAQLTLSLCRDLISSLQSVEPLELDRSGSPP